MTILYTHVDMNIIREDLICTMKNILKWFKLNSLKANPGKFQFIILGDKTCYKILGDKTCYKHILKIINLCSV